jgi:hypothetical protein
VDDRASNFGHERENVASIAATGYALASLLVAVEHGWIKRSDAIERASLTLRFSLGMPNERGWLVHWVDGGKVFVNGLKPRSISKHPSSSGLAASLKYQCLRESTLISCRTSSLPNQRYLAKHFAARRTS